MAPSTRRPCRVIMHRGRADWGDTTRADMTFSIAKILGAGGLAVEDGLIADLDAPVQRAGAAFRGDHNERITWRRCCR